LSKLAIESANSKTSPAGTYPVVVDPKFLEEFYMKPLGTRQKEILSLLGNLCFSINWTVK